MEQTIVFIYSKDNNVKVLSIEESKKLHNELISEGWKHTSTLNACVFISELCNNIPDSELRNCINSISI
jgi:hypothetical protein